MTAGTTDTPTTATPTVGPGTSHWDRKRVYRSWFLRVTGTILVAPFLVGGGLWAIGNALNGDFLEAAGGVCWVVIPGWPIWKFCLRSGLVIDGDRVIVRNMGRPHVTHRHEVIDIAAGVFVGPSGGASRAIVLLRDDGRPIRPIGIFDNYVVAFFTGRIYTETVRRHLTAWYLDVPPDHPSVDTTLERTGTISGRQVYVRARFGRIGSWLSWVFYFMMTPFLAFPIFALYTPELRTTDLIGDAIVWSWCLWIFIRITRPRLVASGDTLEVINPLSRKEVFHRDEVVEIRVEDRLVIHARNRSPVGVFASKKRFWENGEDTYPHRIADELETWIDPPWLSRDQPAPAAATIP